MNLHWLLDGDPLASCCLGKDPEIDPLDRQCDDQQAQ